MAELGHTDGSSPTRDRKTRLLRHVPAGLALVVGVALSVSGFLHYQEMDAKRRQMEFTRAGLAAAAALETGVNTDLEVLSSLARFFASTDNVDREGFHTFVSGALEENSSIQSLGWVPRVLRDQRVAFEEAARHAGLTDFRITELDRSLRFKPAADRDEYYPVYFMEPLAGLEAGVGIDLAAVPDRTFRLREVLESWSASGFHRSPIGGGFEENTGYLVFHPTFSKGASLGTAEQRRASLNGFAVAALRIDRLVAESVTGIERTGFLVVDETPGVLKRELYQYQPSRSAGVPQPELVSEQDEGLESQIRAGIHKIEPLEIAGRRWSLLLHPVPGSLKSHSPFQRWVVLASGLVATALLGAYLFSRSNRSRRIETHAVALTQANENLARENAERRRAETALRESEERARASLTEKEVLLKEVHHRVKNNLQLISSLLNLQAAKSPDAPGVEMLHDSRNRVKAMALIHDKLYRSGDFANIDFGDYARGLVADLFHSYKTDPTAVSSHVDIDDVKLTVETAMPCGLIINELIANALEHGFPDGRSGEVRIQLHAVDDQTALLTVRDTGVGFPEELDFRQTESLGMQLVTTLTDQIGGAIELDRSGGTAFRIRFPVHHLSAIDAGLKSEAAAMAAHSEQVLR